MSPSILISELIFGWANKTFDGQGFGFLGHTADWQWGRSLLGTEFADLFHSYPVGEGEGSWTYLPNHHFGQVMVIKKGLGEDGYGRPGRFVVRVLVAPRGSMSAGQAIATIAREFDLTFWALEAKPDSNLPNVVAVLGPDHGVDTVVEPVPQGAKPVMAQLLAARVDDQKKLNLPVSDLIRILDLLPRGVVRDLSVSCGRDRLASRASVLITEGEDQDNSPRWGGRQDPEEVGSDADLLLEVAEAYLTLGVLAPEEIDSVSGLQKWTRQTTLLTRDEKDLTNPELLELLALGANFREQEARYALEAISRVCRNLFTVDELSNLRNLAESPNSTVVIRAQEAATRQVSFEQLSLLWFLLSPELREKVAVQYLYALGPSTGLTQEQIDFLTPYLHRLVVHLPAEELLLELSKKALWRAILMNTWGVGAERLVRGFWFQELSMTPDLAQINLHYWKNFAGRVGDFLNVSNLKLEELEASIRALPPGALQQAVEYFPQLFEPRFQRDDVSLELSTPKRVRRSSFWRVLLAVIYVGALVAISIPLIDYGLTVEILRIFLIGLGVIVGSFAWIRRKSN